MYAGSERPLSEVRSACIAGFAGLANHLARDVVWDVSDMVVLLIQGSMVGGVWATAELGSTCSVSLRSQNC